MLATFSWLVASSVIDVSAERTSRVQQRAGLSLSLFSTHLISLSFPSTSQGQEDCEIRTRTPSATSWRLSCGKTWPASRKEIPLSIRVVVYCYALAHMLSFSLSLVLKLTRHENFAVLASFYYSRMPRLARTASICLFLSFSIQTLFSRPDHLCLVNYTQL